MHETVGHLRNALRNNGWGSRMPEYYPEYLETHTAMIARWAVYELLPDGTYIMHHPSEVFEKGFK